MRMMAVLAALVVLGAMGLAAAAAVVLGGLPERRDLELAFGSPAGLAGLFTLSIVSTAALVVPVPGMALTIIAATTGPPIVVGIVAGAGQTLGELTGYAAGRGADELANERLSSSRLGGWMRRFGTPSLFLLALIPNPVFDVAGLLAGSLRMSVLRFLLLAGAGKVLRNVVIALLVSHGHDLFLGRGHG